MLADPATQAADLRKPGHIFPLRYRPGGVIVRPGHTEAAVDLARLAGCHPSGKQWSLCNETHVHVTLLPFASGPGASSNQPPVGNCCGRDAPGGPPLVGCVDTLDCTATFPMYRVVKHFAVRV